MGSRNIEQRFKSALLRASKLVRPIAALESFSVSSVRSILVVRQHNELGDMLCCVPLLRALRQHLPEARITLVASPINYAIMLHNPYVDEVLLYDKRHVMRFRTQLKSRVFNLAVVPCTVSVSVTSDVIAYFSGAKVRVGPQSLNGVENPSGFLHNVRVSLDWTQSVRTHQTEQNLRILEPMGISTGDQRIVVGLTEEERAWAGEFLGERGGNANRLIGFHPGAGKRSNRWPADRFAGVANVLTERLGARTVVTSGPKDRATTDSFLSKLKQRAVVVENRTIREVAGIVDQLDLFITNDTGVMHVAGGTSVPVLSLFGPTDPHQWAPIGGKNRFIFSEDGSVESISEDSVTAAALDMLGNA